ncbi:hypothetical protein DFH06DRAFT_1125537 [Mycena polygramma]|nr:hypothetical protein DFH06DRAFT_1125537 [Mycena polygramma]
MDAGMLDTKRAWKEQDNRRLERIYTADVYPELRRFDAQWGTMFLVHKTFASQRTYKKSNEDSNRSYRAYSQDWILKRPSYSQIPNAKSQMPRQIHALYTPYTRLIHALYTPCRFSQVHNHAGRVGSQDITTGACKCIFNSERNYLNRVVLGVKSRLNPYVKEGRAGVAPQ